MTCKTCPRTAGKGRKQCNACLFFKNAAEKSTLISKAVQPIEEKPMTKKETAKLRGLTRTYIRAKQKGIAKLKQADAALDEIVRLAGPGVEILVPDLKAKVVLKDNFPDGKTTAFRPARVRLVDGVIEAAG